MAASKDFASSIVESSEETFDACCSPCSEAGKTKEAKTFCVECGSYFCEDCLLHHNKFPVLRSHHVLDKSGKGKSEQDGSGTALSTERCAIHHGKLIDMFCGDHDEVCCAACIAIKHRTCVNVDHLPDIAQGILNSPELKDTLHSLQDVLARMKHGRENLNGNLASLDQEKDQFLKEVDKYKRELIEKIKELAEVAKQQICSKHEEYKKAIQSDVDSLDTGISTTATSLQKLSSKTETQLFMNVRNSKKSISDCETLLTDLSSEKSKKELLFTLNVGLKDKLTTLGSVTSADEDVKEYKATLYGKFKVSPGKCEITGACCMEDGTYLISDYTNKQLKRLNKDFTVKDKIQIDNNPYSLQIVGAKEVAVFLGGGSVQFVSIGDDMKLTTSFTAAEVSAGGSFNSGNDEMFCLNNEQLCIYRKSGELLRTYDNKDINQRSEPKQTALSDDKETIFLANGDKGLLALSREGTTLWTLTCHELIRAWGVCVLPGNITLVSGFSSNSILQVDKKGKKIGVLLGPSEKINRPLALAFDRSTSRLVVGCSSNEIHVYTLSKIE